jgi:hypothetical protein
VRDAHEFEKRGIPSLALCSEPFRLEAETTARLLGMPHMRLGMLTHPISTLNDDQLRDRAREALALVDALLLKERASPTL